MRQQSFQNAIDSSVICRWRYRELVLDVMPHDIRVLGFGNRWYPDVMASAEEAEVDGYSIKRISAPLFLATKLEAFNDRGKGDFFMSRDIQDIVALIDGRPELAGELTASTVGVQEYIRDRLSLLRDNPDFLYALPAHLPYQSDERAAIIENRISLLTG